MPTNELSAEEQEVIDFLKRNPQTPSLEIGERMGKDVRGLIMTLRAAGYIRADLDWRLIAVEPTPQEENDDLTSPDEREIRRLRAESEALRATMRNAPCMACYRVISFPEWECPDCGGLGTLLAYHERKVGK